MANANKDFTKLAIFLQNGHENETDDHIRAICQGIAPVIKFNRPKPSLAFPQFRGAEDAKNAKDRLIAQGYRCDFANKRTDNASECSDNVRNQSDVSRSRPNLNQDDGLNGRIDQLNTSGHSDNSPYGICLKCGDKAYYNCGRCGDFYCSEECQASDWLTHKQNCFKMPKLVTTKSIHSLHTSRVNLSKSAEKIENIENDGSSLDAPDGHEKISASPPTQELNDSKPNNVENNHRTESVMPSTNVVESEKDENQIESARQRLVSMVSNGSDHRSTAAAKNGLVLNSISNDSEVYITHVKSYSCVYIRSRAASDEYARLITEVEMASKSAPKLKFYPSRGDIVLAPFDGVYYRAMVINCNKDNASIRVGYIDFGNSEEIAFSAIKELPKELKEKPRYTVLVNLKNIEGDIEKNEMITLQNYLESLSETGTSALLKVKCHKAEIVAKDDVELFDVISNQSVNETLNGMVKKRYRISDLKQNIVKDSNCELLVIERTNDNIITCIKKDDVNAFMAGDEQTQAYGESVKNAPAYKPKVKELCVVKVKEVEGDVWYRCLYQQELYNDRAQVYCIDYGKISNVSANEIRVMTNALEHEIKSFVCCIKNIDDIPAEKRTKVIQSLDHFKPTSIEYDGDAHVITIPTSN